MKNRIANFLLVAAITLPLSTFADVDQEMRNVQRAGSSQKFLRLLSAVNNNCSKDTAKRLAGSALQTFNTDIFNLSRFAQAEPTPECKKATANFKAYASELVKTNKLLLIKLLQKMSTSPEQDQNAACADLQVGRSRYPLWKNFRVSRMRENDYLVEVNLYFTAGAGVDKSYEVTMRQRVDQCLNQTGYFQDAAGTRIKLQLARPTGHNIEAHNIQILKNIRTNSGAYDINIPCLTIIHEVLHVAGLWDEYQEDGFNCRPLAKSVMSNQFDYSVSKYGFRDIPSVRIKDPKGIPGANPLEVAFSQPNTEFTKVDSVMCYDVNSRGYRTLIRGEDGKIYFTESDGFMAYRAQVITEDIDLIPTQESTQTAPKSERPYLTKMMKLNPQTDWDCKIATQAIAKKIQAHEMNSVDSYPIRAAHVRKIIYPNCVQKNVRYDTCMQEAYNRNVKDSSCPVKKFASCQGDKFLE